MDMLSGMNRREYLTVDNADADDFFSDDSDSDTIEEQW
jgi:hypothetical protein